MTYVSEKLHSNFHDSSGVDITATENYEPLRGYKAGEGTIRFTF